MAGVEPTPAAQISLRCWLPATFSNLKSRYFDVAPGDLHDIVLHHQDKQQQQQASAPKANSLAVPGQPRKEDEERASIVQFVRYRGSSYGISSEDDSHRSARAASFGSQGHPDNNSQHSAPLLLENGDYLDTVALLRHVLTLCHKEAGVGRSFLGQQYAR
jgi:hypothetical protein